MPSRLSSNRLTLFLKAPHPGRVKTRLAADLGSEAACAAHVRLVETVLGNLSTLDGVELRFTPDDSLAEIERWLRPGWQAKPQGSGDLGEKLARAVRQTLASGAHRVVVIGSDCPEVTSTDIEAAWTALTYHDVVLGPAADGGYWLIGLRSGDTPVFEGISWSTPRVLEQTLARCRVAHLKVMLLRELRDVDTLDDWKRFCARD